MESVQSMLIDTKINLPFYGSLCLFISFHERKDIPTCGVNYTSKGMNFYYSSEFLNGLSQKEVNFIMIHEEFHLLWNHPQRTITGQYDHKLSNIAQDMIINHVIWEDIKGNFVEIPKDKDGKNMALFVPKEYTGKLIFEELYNWLREEQDKRKKDKKEGDGEGDKEEDDKDSYGPHGKDPKNSDGGTIDTYSLDKLFDDLEKSQGQYMDVHMGDEIPEEMRESMVKDSIDRLRSRGLSSENIESTLNKLQKQRKDYLKYIKRAVSNLIFGSKKEKTITKPNRRQILGLKGSRKVKTQINVILDCSGSMTGLTNRVLSYIARNDITCNIIIADTEIKNVVKITSIKELQKMKLSGFGGTVMQVGFDYVEKNFNQYATVLLTDGYVDTLDISRMNKNVLIISAGVECPIGKTNNKLKQIVIDKDDI
jgi:predicted metal-dependent peptidase